MIDFKDRDSQLPSAIIVASLVILLGTLLFMLFVPHPKTPSELAYKKQMALLIKQKEQAVESAADSQTVSDALVFRGDPEDVMARALALLTNRAQKVQIQITAFRPQKTVVIGGLTEIPVSMQVAGPYTNLLTFLKGIGATDARVAVSSFQVASGGDATSNVAATIGIAVFVPATDATPTTTPTTRTPPTPRPATVANPANAPVISEVPAKGVRRG